MVGSPSRDALPLLRTPAKTISVAATYQRLTQAKNPSVQPHAHFASSELHLPNDSHRGVPWSLCYEASGRMCSIDKNCSGPMT